MKIFINNKLIFKMHLKKNNFLIIFIFSFLLISCIGSSVTSMAGNAVITEKGIESSINDVIIYTKVKTSLLKLGFSNITDIGINVSQGKILLVGSLTNNEDRLIVIKKLWEIEGVKEIYNEIILDNEYGFKEKTKDFLLVSEIKTRLLFNSEILSNNYSIDSLRGTIYLIGISSSLEEIKVIEDFIKNISGVKKVKSFITYSKEIIKKGN